MTFIRFQRKSVPYPGRRQVLVGLLSTDNGEIDHFHLYSTITSVLVWQAAAGADTGIKLHAHTRRADSRASQRTAVWHAVSM